MATPSAIQPDIRIDTIRPLIENFFTRTTSEEWDMLKMGKPDNITKVLLAELFIHILKTVSTALLKTREDSVTTVTPEDVRNGLGDTISESFALGGELESVNLDDLTDLVVQEVTDTINSSLSTSPVNVPPEEVLLTRVTDPGKLNQMISIISKMFKAFAGKLNCLYGGKLRQGRSRTTQSQEQNPAEGAVSEMSFSIIETAITSKDGSRLSSTAPRSDECETVEEVILKEVTDITETIFDEILDVENIEQNSSVEIINAAEAITKPAIEESIKIVTGEGNSPNSKKKGSSKKSSTGKRRKLKNLFAKTFATAWIFKILTQVKRCFKKKPKVKSKQSINHLMGDIYAQLKTEMKLTAEGETCVFEKVNNLPPDRVLLFTKEIAGLLYMYVTNQKIDSKSPLVVPESGMEIYSEILKKVSYFLSIMSWFVNKQVDGHTKRVMAACRSSPVRSEIPQVSDPKNNEKKKNKKKNKNRKADDLTDSQKDTYVRILVNQIVTKTHTKTKVALECENVPKMMETLFDNTWAELKYNDLDLITQNLKYLSRNIFKDLCKRWSCPEMLLAAMRMNEPEVGECIATSLKRQLSRSSICKFFVR